MKILYFGRKNDFYSISLYKFLKKLDKKCKAIWSDGINNNLRKKINDCEYIICFRSNIILKKKHARY